MVQWLRLCISIARGRGSVPGQGTKIPQAAWRGQKNKTNKKQKQNENTQNKTWKQLQVYLRDIVGSGPHHCSKVSHMNFLVSQDI